MIDESDYGTFLRKTMKISYPRPEIRRPTFRSATIHDARFRHESCRVSQLTIGQKRVKSFRAKVSAFQGRNIHCTLPNGEQNPIDFITPVSRCHELHFV